MNGSEDSNEHQIKDDQISSHQQINVTQPCRTALPYWWLTLAFVHFTVYSSFEVTDYLHYQARIYE